MIAIDQLINRPIIYLSLTQTTTLGQRTQKQSNTVIKKEILRKISNRPKI